MKLAIGIPSGDMVHMDFTMSLLGAVNLLMHPSLDVNIAVINKRNAVIQQGRHEIVVEAQELKADKLLFVDSDMVFPSNAFADLLKHECRVVGCNYSTRVEPAEGTAMISGKILSVDEEGTSKVDCLGFGMILIDMTVFNQMDKPFFQVYWDGDDYVGEDYDFCNSCGCHVYCDHDLSKEIRHVGNCHYNLGDEK